MDDKGNDELLQPPGVDSRSQRGFVREAFAFTMACVLLTNRAFFDIYRQAAFRTLPLDDYAAYLLALVGEGGDIPGNPHGYRFLSVLPAVPLYYAVPRFVFSQLRSVEGNYLHAQQSLALLSYLAMVGVCLLGFLTARSRFHCSLLTAITAATLSLLLTGFLVLPGVDPMGVFWVSLCALFLQHIRIFSVLVLLGVGVNEKIPLIFAALFLGRIAGDAADSFRSRWGRFPARGDPWSEPSPSDGSSAPGVGTSGNHRWASSLWGLTVSGLALAVYFAVRLCWALPGNAQLTDGNALAGQALAGLRLCMTPRGLALNVAPLAALGLVCWLSWWGSTISPQGAFRRGDLAAVAVLFGVSLAVGTGDNLGRVVLYCFPLYVVPAACWMEHWSQREQYFPPRHPKVRARAQTASAA